MFVTVRRIVLAIIVTLFLLIAVVFSFANPEPISLDIGLVRFESVSLALALALSFTAGALFGGSVVGFALFRHYRERRTLRRELRRIESELSSARIAPTVDAD